MSGAAFGISNRDTHLEAKFKIFHAQNPLIYTLFDGFTRELVGRKISHASARDIIARIRWEFITQGSERVHVNNNHTPYYARLWENQNPQHKGFFIKKPIYGGS